jgi:hypothetical protein
MTRNMIDKQMNKLTDISFIMIGQHTVVIELVDSPVEFSKYQDEKKEKENFLGLFSAETLTIYIKKDLPPSLLKDTLLHEILHALWFLSGAGAVGEEDENLEELLVGMLTPWLMSILKDNPKLVGVYFD